MRGNLLYVLLIGAILASAVRAGDRGKCCSPECGHCIVPPPFCPKCTSACDECRLRLCPSWNAKEARVWVEQRPVSWTSSTAPRSFSPQGP